MLIDNEPKMHERYQQLNMEKNVLALNLDGIEGLKRIKGAIGNNELVPRRLVVAFRIDHRMIPDTDNFVKLLGSVIAENAKLIITIGAGHTNKEFKGRLRKIDELMASLEKYDLNPVKIKWYRDGSLAERRGNPIFDAPTYATYEVLYCQLIRSRLAS